MRTGLMGIVSQFRWHDVMLCVIGVTRFGAVVARTDVVVGQGSWDHQHHQQDHKNSKYDDSSHKSPLLLRLQTPPTYTLQSPAGASPLSTVSGSRTALRIDREEFRSIRHALRELSLTMPMPPGPVTTQLLLREPT